MKIEYIEWVDAMQNLEGWMDFDEAKQWADSNQWIIHQVGFVMEENKDYILMCLKKTEDFENMPAMYGAIIKIPKPWIVKRIDLSKHIK